MTWHTYLLFCWISDNTFLQIKNVKHVLMHYSKYTLNGHAGIRKQLISAKPTVCTAMLLHYAYLRKLPEVHILTEPFALGTVAKGKRCDHVTTTISIIWVRCWDILDSRSFICQSWMFCWPTILRAWSSVQGVNESRCKYFCSFFWYWIVRRKGKPLYVLRGGSPGSLQNIMTIMWYGWEYIQHINHQCDLLSFGSCVVWGTTRIRIYEGPTNIAHIPSSWICIFTFPTRRT